MSHPSRPQDNTPRNTDTPSDTSIPQDTSMPPDNTSPEHAAGPWYKDGLCFECTQCGNCCTGSPGFVWVEEDEIQAIADYLEKPLGEIRLSHTRPARGRTSLREYANGDCIYFDPETRGCTIYPARPRQCRTWPFWKSNLTSEAAWHQNKSTCPGLDRGNFFPLEQIEILASQVDV